MTIPTKPLNDGHSIPAIGLGTFGLRGTSGVASVVSGIDAGYRLLDTALRYKNEKVVGEGVRSSDVPREDIMVTTKLPGRHHGFDATLSSFEQSRTNLGLEYVDLYLIHWPLPHINKYVDSWRAMIRLRDEGLVRSIGVSNFTPKHLIRLIEETDVAPAVNQIEMHPNFPQAAAREFHAAHDIITVSWGPLGRKRRLRSNRVIVRIAEAHGITPTQAVLRWHVQSGAVPIPKSGNPERQAANLDVFDFELTEAEMASISALETGRRLWGGDPDTHEEF